MLEIGLTRRVLISPPDISFYLFYTSRGLNKEKNTCLRDAESSYEVYYALFTSINRWQDKHWSPYSVIYKIFSNTKNCKCGNIFSTVSADLRNNTNKKEASFFTSLPTRPSLNRFLYFPTRDFSPTWYNYYVYSPSCFSFSFLLLPLLFLLLSSRSNLVHCSRAITASKLPHFLPFFLPSSLQSTTIYWSSSTFLCMLVLRPYFYYLCLAIYLKAYSHQSKAMLPAYTLSLKSP